MITRRFEFTEGTSSKFWEVDPNGDTLAIRWGKIGTGGQSQNKSFADEAAASKALEKLVLEKTKKGYVEVGGSEPAGSVATASAKAAPEAGAASTPKATAAVGTGADLSNDIVLKRRKSFPTFQSTAPVIEGGELFWGTTDKASEVHAAGLDGKLRWTSPCDAGVQAVHANGEHVIVRSLRAVEWFERGSGKPCARVEVEETSLSELIGDTLFVLLRQEIVDPETRKLVLRTPHCELLVFEGLGQARPTIQAPSRCFPLGRAGDLLLVNVPESSEVVAYRRSGELAWTAAGSLLAGDDSNVLVHHEGNLILLTSGGAPVWSQLGVVPAGTWPSGGMGFGAVALAESRTVDLRCFELSSGAPRWSTPVALPKRGFRRPATPLVSADAVFLTDGTDRLCAFSLADGRLLSTLKERTERGLAEQGAIANGEPVVALAHHGDSRATMMLVSAGRAEDKAATRAKRKTKA